MKRFALIFTLLLFLLGCSSAAPEASSKDSSLILATTTSTQDSGLLDELVPRFQSESGHTVQTIAVGTGAALKMAEEGNADVLLVHAPSAEKMLMENGFGKDRRLIMHNDFVLVGPQADPAGIKGDTQASAALAQIASSGASFVSRGDDSGTNKKELTLWQNTTVSPNSNKPAWYIESGQGMGSTLFIASEKSAYTMTDRATYLANQENLDLDILVEGDTVLLNIYHVITVNPDKWPNTNYAAALEFADFITDADTQSVIAEFGIDTYGQPLFFPDAHRTAAELGLE